jgi:hypothetical protein
MNQKIIIHKDATLCFFFINKNQNDYFYNKNLLFIEERYPL